MRHWTTSFVFGPPLNRGDPTQMACRAPIGRDLQTVVGLVLAAWAQARSEALTRDHCLSHPGCVAGSWNIRSSQRVRSWSRLSRH